MIQQLYLILLLTIIFISLALIKYLSNINRSENPRQTVAILEDLPKVPYVELENIIRSSLQIRLGDEQLGKDIYDGLLRKTFLYEERWSNYHFKGTLVRANEANLPLKIQHEFYRLIVDLKYDTKLRQKPFLFSCTDNLNEHEQNLRNPDCEFSWIYPKDRDFGKIDERVFRVPYINVQGLNLHIEEVKRIEGNRIDYIGTHSKLPDLIGELVTIEYRVEVLINKLGHLYYSTIIYPTRNISIEFDYAETDIHFVNALDFFVSQHPAKIRYTPSYGPNARKIEVTLDEWAFPKGGAVFVWVLEKEMTADFPWWPGENPQNSNSQ